ncbi:MAG: hypothetical protein Q8R91_01725 [Candidatus Omnitrophota bacterium]|nr:hypothetical protein [Candidatus Omnitrophota bacterium]
MSKPCQTCFAPRTDLADVLREEAENLVAAYGWTGGERVLSNIKHERTVINIHAHLAVLRVAQILTFPGTEWPKPRLEERCRLHPARGPHDVVLPLGEGQRVIVEIRRFDHATAAGDVVEEKTTTYVCKHQPLPDDNSPELLKEIKDDPEKSKGRLALVLEAINEKQNQLDPSGINVIWFVTRNSMCQPEIVVEDIPWYYKQLECPYQRPEHLTALAWSFDGPSGPCVDSYLFGALGICALLNSCPILEDRMKAVGIRVTSPNVSEAESVD